MKNISGVLLAGGANKRFNGSIKAKMLVGEKPLISGSIATLEEIFGEIIIVTNTPSEFRDYQNYKIVSDIYRNKGPLGGIHAAINASSKKAVFVFAADMPFLSKDLILNQIENFNNTECEALIPRMGFCDEPLHAIYSNSIFIRLDYYLLRMKNYKVSDFLERINVSYLNIPGTPANEKAFTNINTPSDLEAAIRILEQTTQNKY